MAAGRSRSRLRSATPVIGVVVLAILMVGVSPASGQPYGAPTINGNMIMGTYTAPNSQPFLVGGYQFPPDLAGNVTGITCSGGGTPNLTGGPGGSPECLFGSAVTTATVTITGRTAWPNTVTLTPFWSFDNRTYVMGAPVTATTPGTPIKISTETGLKCDAKTYRALWWPQGHPAIPSVGFSSYPVPHVELYSGTGSQYPSSQLAASLDAQGNASYSSLCTPLESVPSGKARKARMKAAPEAAGFTCTSKEKAGVVVDPSDPDRIQVISGGKVVFDATLGGTPKSSYDKKSCKKSPPPE